MCARKGKCVTFISKSRGFNIGPFLKPWAGENKQNSGGCSAATGRTVVSLIRALWKARDRKFTRSGPAAKKRRKKGYQSQIRVFQTRNEIPLLIPIRLKNFGPLTNRGLCPRSSERSNCRFHKNSYYFLRSL